MNHRGTGCALYAPAFFVENVVIDLFVESRAIGGASTWQMYRHIIIPLLKPITVSTLIILGHISLKIFDLVFAMSGKGPGFATDVPGIFVIEQSFGANRYNLGAAAAVVMLILVSIVIVPYLARAMKDVE